MSTILVTGGSGFIAGHLILRLLGDGHEVRTTIRRPGREADVRAALARGGVGPEARLSFHVADLQADAGWPEAVAGCDHVHHVASPAPLAAPAHEDDLIVPAREGTLRALRAARNAGVRRVVLTSSFAAIAYGSPGSTAPFDETHWSDPDGAEARPYVKSKTLAERAAWAFAAAEGDGMELAVVNPVGVLGPVLGPDIASSVSMVQALMGGALPDLPRSHFGVVDVRDVADLHVRAMTDPAAHGERFLAVAGDVTSLREIATALLRHFGDSADAASHRDRPAGLVRLAAVIDSQPASHAGVVRNISGDKARRLLGWAPRSNGEAAVATAESLIRLRLV